MRHIIWVYNAGVNHWAIYRVHITPISLYCFSNQYLLAHSDVAF